VLAFEVDVVLAEEAVDDLELLTEARHAHARRREVEAVGLVLALHPAGTKPERDPAAGDLVGGRGGVRQHRRVTECGGRDERPELQLRRVCSEAGDRRPRIEHVTRLVEARHVVVGAEQRLDSVLLACVGERDPVVPGDSLLPLDHQREPHGG
jgi:hypothetical protein